jgi:signal transduction histidine kinase
MHSNKDRPVKRVSENVRTDEEIIMSEKLEALERLSDRLSHKINNLLTSVLNYSFILKSSATDRKAIAMHEKIEDGIKKTKDILQGIVDSSRHAPEAFEEFDFENEMKAIARSFSLTGGKSGVTMDTRFQGRPSVRCSRRCLHIVMSNILQNAVEAEATGIKVNSRITDTDISIEIIDNGTGIRREDLPRVFEPMFTTKHEKRGLGLYMTYNIIKSHGGSISCSSRPGKDTRFHVTIPVDGSGSRNTQTESRRKKPDKGQA